jgi:hypothetical protein
MSKALLMVMLLMACGSPMAPAPSLSPSGTPSAVAGGPPFSCADATGGGSVRANVVTVRADRNVGFDRFVLEFDGPVPGYRVTRQANANFTEDASGRPVTLEGTAGVVVRLEPASSLPSAPLAVTPRSAVLREARQIGDFEGVVRWGLGLASTGCLRVQTLSGPARLVIDFQT